MDGPPFKFWRPCSFNIFRVCTEGILVLILSRDLIRNIINQQPQFATNKNAKKIKSKMKLIKMQHHNEELQKLRSTLSDEQKGLNESNREQGASSLLSTTIPPS